MERPVMNPLFMDGEQAPRPRRTLLQRLAGAVRFAGGLLLADIAFWKGKDRLKIEDASPLGRVLHAIFYRLIFVPFFLIVIVMTLVYIGTHPPRVLPSRDPMTSGLYYDPVSYASRDGALLEAWLVPLFDASMVLEHKEQLMRARQPAVILVHDYSASREQMLPLVKPLHEAGYVVLVTSLRGTAKAPLGLTFGLREADDVQAAVEMLRRRPGIDPTRIAILGVGTGANAAILAAERDSLVAAVVLDRPVAKLEDLVSEHLCPPQTWMSWIRPVTRWTFELAYHVNAEDLDIARRQTMTRTPMLVFDPAMTSTSSLRTKGIEQTLDFLEKYVGTAFAEAQATTVEQGGGDSITR